MKAWALPLAFLLLLMMVVPVISQSTTVLAEEHFDTYFQPLEWQGGYQVNYYTVQKTINATLGFSTVNHDSRNGTSGSAIVATHPLPTFLASSPTHTGWPYEYYPYYFRNYASSPQATSLTAVTASFAFRLENFTSVPWESPLGLYFAGHGVNFLGSQPGVIFFGVVKEPNSGSIHLSVKVSGGQEIHNQATITPGVWHDVDIQVDESTGQLISIYFDGSLLPLAPALVAGGLSYPIPTSAFLVYLNGLDVGALTDLNATSIAVQVDDIVMRTGFYVTTPGVGGGDWWWILLVLLVLLLLALYLNSEKKHRKKSK